MSLNKEWAVYGLAAKTSQWPYLRRVNLAVEVRASISAAKPISTAGAAARRTERRDEGCRIARMQSSPQLRLEGDGVLRRAYATDRECIVHFSIQGRRYQVEGF